MDKTTRQSLQRNGIWASCSFLIVFFFCASLPASSQSTILMKGEEKIIHPLISASDKSHTEIVEYTITLSGEAPSDSGAASKRPILLELYLDQGRPSSIKPTLSEKVIMIEPASWPGTGKSVEIKKQLLLATSAVGSFGADELFLIKIKGSSLPESVKISDSANSNVLVRVTTVGAYDHNKSFWVEVGSNFDLVDGIEPNNFFSGVFFYKRDIRPFPFQKAEANKKVSNIAIFAGVFESKSITSVTENPLALRRYYDSTSIIPGSVDSIRTYTALGTILKKTTIRNVGLFFSPQVRLTKGSANANGLHIFASFWAELQWQRIMMETSFKGYGSVDTIIRPVNDVINSDSFQVKELKTENDIRSHYLGLGLPIFFKESLGDNTIHLFVNPIFGFTSQPTEEYLLKSTLYESDPVKFARPDKTWSPFYAVQFRLNEENYGVAFTGEVRGLLKRNNKPFVSISLSKKFDLSKFIEYNK